MPHPKYVPVLPWWHKVVDRTLVTVMVCSELLKIPASVYIFHRHWAAESSCKPYWRPGILWAFLQSTGKIFKWELLVALGFSLPHILQASNFVRIHLSSFERKARRDLLHRRKRLRAIEKPREETADEDGGDESYNYAALDSSDNEIRLLCLHPGSRNEQVRVDIIYASLYDKPQYIALSYVWGEAAERTHSISVNGSRYHITESLLHALEHLRNVQGPDAQIPFWIDALCINQNNDSEKSEQVLRMKDIYSQAYKVLVWLGPPSEKSELALAKMKAIEAMFYIGMHSNEPVQEEDREEEKYQKKSTDVVDTSRQNRNGYEPLMFLYDEYDQQFQGTLDAIADFLDNPWWGRAWIAQEVSSPTSHNTPLGNVEIVMGRQLQTISFRSTVKMLVFVLHLGVDRGDSQGDPVADMLKKAEKASIGISRLTSISKLREESTPISQRIIMAITGALSRMESRPTIEQLLWTLKVRPMLNLFRGLQCQNSVDKVYAALPLVLPSGHSAFAPNYELSTADVYIQVVESFIKYERCLSILADRSGTNPEMPSWVPDFRCLAESHSMCMRFDTHCRPIYRASGKRNAGASVSREIFFPKIPPSRVETETEEVHEPKEVTSSLRSVLNAQGVILDKIKILAPFVTDAKTIRRPDWEKLLEELPKHYVPTNEPTTHSYQRILTADVERSSVFYGYESFATFPQKVAGELEGLERNFLGWITQAHKNLPSYSVLQAFDDISGPRRKHDVWKRGAPIDDAFFTRPEPPKYPDTSLLSDAESKIVLAKRDEARRVKDLIENTTVNRVFCVTEKGYMGLVPYRSKEDDLIVVLSGGHTPFVLRERESDIPTFSGNERRWQLIGECYVHGFMDGEALNGLDQQGTDVRFEKFVLI